MEGNDMDVGEGAYERHLPRSHVIRKHSFHENQIMLDITILYMAEEKLPAYVPVRK